MNHFNSQKHGSNRVKEMLKSQNSPPNSRKYPRFFIDLPIEYQTADVPLPHAGILVNGSEKGFLIHSKIDLPVGENLNIMVLFSEGYQLNHFEAIAEIVWKNIHRKEEKKGFEYGLRILQIKEEDFLKLKELLKGQFGCN